MEPELREKPDGARPGEGGARRAAPAAALLLALAACDLPTDAPNWDTRWQVPAQGASFSVEDFLPAGVEEDPDSGGFLLDADPVSFGRTLAELCPPCAQAEGQTVPKPAFTAELGSSLSLPDDVESVDLAAGTVIVHAGHDFDFDPIRPGQGNTGELKVELVDADDGRSLASVTADGETEAFPPGQDGRLEWEVELEPGQVGGGFEVRVLLESPEGDDVEVDGESSLQVEVVPGALEAASARIRAGGLAADLSPVSLDVEGLDAEVVDRVEEGALLLEVSNPFGVGLEAEVTIAGQGFPDIHRSVALSSEPSSGVEVSLSGEELRSFLGRPGVTLSGTAAVPGHESVMTVGPGQVVDLDFRIDLTLRMGS